MSVEGSVVNRREDLSGTEVLDSLEIEAQDKGISIKVKDPTSPEKALMKLCEEKSIEKGLGLFVVRRTTAITMAFPQFEDINLGSIKKELKNVGDNQGSFAYIYPGEVDGVIQKLISMYDGGDFDWRGEYPNIECRVVVRVGNELKALTHNKIKT
jgi:hypothetical protein